MPRINRALVTVVCVATIFAEPVQLHQSSAYIGGHNGFFSGFGKVRIASGFGLVQYICMRSSIFSAELRAFQDQPGRKLTANLRWACYHHVSSMSQGNGLNASSRFTFISCSNLSRIQAFAFRGNRCHRAPLSLGETEFIELDETRRCMGSLTLFTKLDSRKGLLDLNNGAAVGD